jgi:hypothetical protein
VPAFAGPAIDRLYAHLYCSPSYFEMAREIDGASTYLAWRGDGPAAVLLYKRTNSEITVISDYVAVDAHEIHRFADYMFGRFESVNVISFRKLHADLRKPGYPSHAVNCIEDLIITPPATVREYEDALGKNMRRNIKRYSNALLKNFPSFRYQVYLGAEISEQHIRDIVELSCTRMKSKNVEPRFNEEETQWIIGFAKQCGLVGVATIDGKICAGTIAFRMGDNYFMHVNAHSVELNEYSLGILCCYRTICECITRGAKRIHLLQGRFGYKYRLLAQRKDFFHLDIYRDRVQFIAHVKRVLRKEFNGRLWLAKQWLLHDIERKEGKVYQTIAKAVALLRAIKRSRGRPADTRDSA